MLFPVAEETCEVDSAGSSIMLRIIVTRRTCRNFDRTEPVASVAPGSFGLVRLIGLH